MFPRFPRLAATLASPFLATAVHAAPVTGSPYFVDRQDSFVYDRTSDVIGTVGMITCIIDSLNPEELVNQGNYAVLVNQRSCDNNSRADTSASSDTGGGSSAPGYANAIVNSSRAGTATGMRVKFWFEDDNDGVSYTIFANLNATAAPSATNPYGGFRLDYAAPNPAGGGLQMQGYLAGAATGITYVERETRTGGGGGGGIGTKQLYLTRSSDTAGAGALSVLDGGTTTSYQFAFDSTHFLRSSGGTDVCFDRRLANAKTSVWRYGIYDMDGNRVLRTSGFPISYTPPGSATAYQGYAGYFGVHMPPEALATLATGSTVTKPNFDSSGAGTSYTVTRAGGRLLKYTRQSKTLAEFSNVRFMFRPFRGLDDATAAAIVPGATDVTIRTRELEAYWDHAARVFKVSGVQSCGSSGCNTAALGAPVTLIAGDATRYSEGLFGFSNSYGGPVSIPATTMATVNSGSPAGAVYYRTQDLVNPGSVGAPTALVCVANCPTATGMATFFGPPLTGTPFGTTANTFAGAASTVAYTFNGTTGLLSSGGSAVVMPVGVTEDTLNGTPYKHGLRTGKMVASATDLVCPGGGPTTYCEQRADELSAYYVWETGINAWNQFVGLRDAGGTLVTFDPPLALNYTVPAGAEFGEYAGRSLILQYSGFGELQGVPGQCVSQGTNAPVACGPNTRFVPQFSIPYTTAAGGTVTDNAGTTYFVKWLNREVRFGRDLAVGACSGLTVGALGSLPLLTGVEDPSATSSSVYIGAKPTVTAAPRVVDGVTRY